MVRRINHYIYIVNELNYTEVVIAALLTKKNLLTSRTKPIKYDFKHDQMYLITGVFSYIYKCFF